MTSAGSPGRGSTCDRHEDSSPEADGPDRLHNEMEVETVSRRTERPAGLDGHTACEALQATAAAHPDRPAIRTRGDEFTCSWGEYAARVQAIAGGLAAGGVRRGDAVALMLVNRPEFHFADSAVKHPGGIPLSGYQPQTQGQIAPPMRDSGRR